MELILLNSRCPDLMEGDLYAMMGSTEIGSQQILDIVKQYGLKTTLKSFEGILDHSDQLMRASIYDVKDGEYVGSESFENDCFDNGNGDDCLKLFSQMNSKALQHTPSKI